MKNEIAHVGNGLSISSIDDIMRVAEIAKRSNYFGIKSSEEAAIKLMYGIEMGLPALQALMGVNVIQGRPTMSSNLVASLIKRSGRYNYTIRSWTDRECVIQFRDNGEQIGESSFTIEDAKRAGLLRNAGNWEKYPKAMLFARAITMGARAFCADVFVAPIYDPEELTPETDTVNVSVDRPAVHTAEVLDVKSHPVETQDAAATQGQVSAPKPFRKMLTEICKGDSQCMKRSVVRVYEYMTHEGLVDGSSANESEMYIAVNRVLTAGQADHAAIEAILRSDEVLIV